MEMQCVYGMGWKCSVYRGFDANAVYIYPAETRGLVRFSRDLIEILCMCGI